MKIESRYRYRFLVTYSLALLGALLIAASHPAIIPFVRRTMRLGFGSMEVVQMLLAGIVCTLASLLFARSLGLSRMGAIVVFALADLCFWLVGPIAFLIVSPLFVWLARHSGRFLTPPSRTFPW